MLGVIEIIGLCTVNPDDIVPVGNCWNCCRIVVDTVELDSAEMLDSADMIGPVDRVDVAACIVAVGPDATAA